MDTKNNNRVNMIDSTTGFCDGHTAATAGMSAFALRLADVKTKRILINTLNQLAIGNTKAVTAATKLLRLTMRKKALKVANATIAYANSVDDTELKGLVSYNKSKLDRLAKGDVDDACQAIHDAALPHVASLGAFGVVAGDLTDLQTAIDLFRIASQNPRQALISKQQAISQSKQLVKEIIEDLLEGQMDKMANTIEEDEPEFWTGYFLARKTIDLGTTFTKVRGTVTNEASELLPGVKFTVLETGTENVVKQVLSNLQGKFTTGKLAVGDFDFKWELNGYKTKTESNVHVSAGKELKRKVTLEAGGGNITAIRGGELGMGVATNINLVGINATPATTASFLVTGPFRIWAAANIGDLLVPGNPFKDFVAGPPSDELADSLAAFLGLGELKPFLMIQNIGAGTAHWQVTFDNLEE